MCQGIDSFRVSGNVPLEPMNKKLRVGVIGAGRWSASAHLPGFTRSPHSEVVALCDLDAELGDEEVMAALVLRAGASIDPVELVGFLGPRLAKFAIPRFIDTLDALPLTDTGKIRRGDLRTRGITATTWDRERSMAGRSA